MGQSELKVATYHAGLDAERRQRVQEGFMAGKLDVMVATIAFGMGIDKPDVRTVIHTALAGSVEGYYQEIGRAGRDGNPSRAIRMHSYGDRHTHDFFFSRDYPDVALMDRVFAQSSDRVSTEGQARQNPWPSRKNSSTKSSRSFGSIRGPCWTLRRM